MFSFLFACKEDDLTLGFRKDPKNFQVYYREFPLESVVFRNDSLFTYNTFSTSATNRLLVGVYDDPQFGKVSSTIYTQFRPTNTTKLPEEGAEFDSVNLQLRFDNYHYGSDETTTQAIDVYEITEEIKNEISYYYYNSSKQLVERLPIGKARVTINPLFLNQIVEQKKDTTLTTTATVSRIFGKALFDAWKTHDSTFTDFYKFKTIFRGLALVPVSGDKILGFNPTAAATKLVLYYHVDTAKYQFDFSLNNSLGYTNFSSDRSNTPIALPDSKKDFVPGDGNGYVQAGIGIFTKLSFKGLVNFKDTVGTAAFSSVELEIPVLDYDAFRPPPGTVALRLVKSDNKFALSNTIGYSQFLIGEGNTDGFYVKDDLASIGVLKFDSETKSYRGYITQFAQGIIREPDPEKRFYDFVLYPYSPDGTKSVNRFWFDRSKVKLKTYYTKPVAGSKTE